MSNVWATMPCVQLSHNMLVNCIDNRQNQLFSEMSLRDVMELPSSGISVSDAWLNSAGIYVSDARLNNTVTSVSDAR